MPKYKIADIVFYSEISDKALLSFLKDYEYFGQEKPLVEFAITKKDCEKEKTLSKWDKEDWYYYSLALLRKFALFLIENDGFILHASAIKVNDKAYLFTAKSGTGKSTHAKIYKKIFGEKAQVINDDKPIIRYIDNKFYAYGSPWSGKEDLNTNTMAEVCGIAKLERSKENSIEKLEEKEIIPMLLNQTVRFDDEKMLDKQLLLFGRIKEKIDFYRLKCNMETSAGKLSYSVMSKGKKNEN